MILGALRQRNGKNSSDGNAPDGAHLTNDWVAEANNEDKVKLIALGNKFRKTLTLLPLPLASMVGT